jgi:hypothetical protein
VPLSGRLVRVLLAVLTTSALGCTGAATRAVERTQLDPEQRYQRALPVVSAYLRAITDHRATGRYTEPGTAWQRRSLARLERWLGGVPARDLRIDTTSLGRDDPRTAGVIVSLAAPLAPDPPTAEVNIGQLALLVRQDNDGRWRVAADLTSRESRLLRGDGLEAVRDARFVVGSSSVVIDATGREPDSFSSGLARRVTDDVLPGLSRRYRGPRRAVIYLTTDWKQAARIVPGDYPNEPTGVTFKGIVILNDAQWRYWGDPGAQGVIVHELTHLETERLMAGAPTSLAEGLAQYEQDRYLHRHHSGMPLAAIGRAYRRGFPTAERWRSADVEWGLRSLLAIQLSYDDAEAMVRTVLVRHGGMAALRRLATGFAGRRQSSGYSLDAVRAVFRTALGVPLLQVEREAHAWVWAASP